MLGMQHFCNLASFGRRLRSCVIFQFLRSYQLLSRSFFASNQGQFVTLISASNNGETSSTRSLRSNLFFQPRDETSLRLNATQDKNQIKSREQAIIVYHTIPRPRHNDVQTSYNKKTSFINFVKRYGKEVQAMLLDKYVRVFLYFSLVNRVRKTSDRNPAQSIYCIFSGRKSQLLIIFLEINQQLKKYIFIFY